MKSLNRTKKSFKWRRSEVVVINPDRSYINIPIIYHVSQLYPNYISEFLSQFLSQLSLSIPCKSPKKNLCYGCCSHPRSPGLPHSHVIRWFHLQGRVWPRGSWFLQCFDVLDANFIKTSTQKIWCFIVGLILKMFRWYYVCITIYIIIHIHRCVCVCQYHRMFYDTWWVETSVSTGVIDSLTFLA